MDPIIIMGKKSVLFLLAFLAASGSHASGIGFGPDLSMDPQDALASAASFDWFRSKDPVPSRSYEPGDPQSQQVVLRGRDLFFIDEGLVFRKNLDSGETVFLRESSRVSAILTFKGQLFALRRTGAIYLWFEAREKWIEVGNETQRLLAAGDDLLALSNGDLWVYQGSPGGLEISWTMIQTPATDGDGNAYFITMYVPSFGGRTTAFNDSGIKGVASMDPVPGGEEVLLRFRDGSLRRYSELRPAREAD
jgi:hypothetical protein